MSEKIEDVSDQFYKQEIHFSLDFFMESDELVETLDKHEGTLLFDGTVVDKGIAFEYLLDFVNLHIKQAKRPLGKYYKTYSNLTKSVIAHKRAYDKHHVQENIEEEKIPMEACDDLLVSFLN